jgi:hypothetical protein
MAEKVYVVNHISRKEAYWQLSEEERTSLTGEIQRARDEAGGKLVLPLRTYSSEWSAIRILVFPDMEAYHKFCLATLALNTEKYFGVDTTLGYESTA